MTAPVTARKVDEKEKFETIEMTAPVTTKASNGMTEVSFIMPSKWTIDTLPVPNNPNITISETEPKTVAVRPFSGYATRSNIVKEKERFLQALTDNNITHTSEFTLSQYNDPWTPAWMRTNEWWVETQK